ncbi:hypothetical protein PG994_013764 [Apiospora phragmitis]|uniref:Ankyrin repeat protein n=1 Tax=Apiospora phragmitis TaxID=2905665 RepID=A0ABR1T2E2_9PEZI
MVRHALAPTQDGRGARRRLRDHVPGPLPPPPPPRPATLEREPLGVPEYTARPGFRGRGAPVDDERRPAYMLVLCRYFMRTLLAKKLRTNCWYRMDVMHSVYDLFRDSLGRGQLVAKGPLERHLLTCQSLLDASAGGLSSEFHAHPGFGPLLLDKDHEPGPLGAGLRGFIIGSTMERFVAVLGPIRGLSFNDDERECLLWAVQSGQLAKVKYLMSWPGHSPHKPYGKKFELAVVEAIRLRKRDIIQYLFQLHRRTGRSGVPFRRRIADIGIVTNLGLVVACWNGDIETVQLFFRHIHESEYNRQHPHLRRTALVHACRSGNADLVSFLLGRKSMTAEIAASPMEDDRICLLCTHGCYAAYIEGCELCCPDNWGFGPVFVAATSGSVQIAQLIVDAGRPVSAKQYEQATIVAVDLDHHRFLQWILDHAGPDLTNPTSTFDMLGTACVRGSVGVLEILASNGLLQDRVLWAEDCHRPYELDYHRVYPQRRYEKPALVAISWKREDILQYLLSRGFEGVADPLETSVKDEWETGWIPRRPSPKIKTSSRCGIQSTTIEQEEMYIECARIYARRAVEASARAGPRVGS